MTSQDALNTVFASAHPAQWYAVLEALLQDGHAAAATLPTSLERRHAHRQHFLWFDGVINALAAKEGLDKMLASGLRLYVADPMADIPQDAPANAAPPITREQFKDLLQHHVGLVKSASAGSRALRTLVRLQYRDRVLRRDLGDALCGTYPFRHADLGIVQVRPAEALSSVSRTGRRYAYADVEPFTRESLSQAERAALYQSRLQVKTMTAADLQSPEEHALIGQRGVFAKTDIPAGVCLGVYGGLILDPVDTFLLEDYSHLIGASDEPGRICVNGETMMSLVNTRFLFDAQGQIAGHPDTGYNVEEASFKVCTSDPREMVLHAYFSSTPITSGTELRVCYELARLDGQPAFSAAEPGQARPA